MAAEFQTEAEGGRGILDWFGTTIGRIVISLLIPFVAFAVLYYGFIFLRESEAPTGVIVAVAIVWGVGGVALLFLLANWFVEQLPLAAKVALRPYVFVGPAMAILIYYLVLPTFRTLWLSFQNKAGEFTLANYEFAFTDPVMLESLRNIALWLVFGTGFIVIFGLLVAILADRSRFEVLAKALIFLPMAISFVGAGVIFRFIYDASRAPGQSQIGLLNAIVEGLGGERIAWLLIQPWNNFFLIAVLIFLQTGFAMVLLSAALKGVPEELLEAGRIDGASEVQIFFRIIIPYIRGTIITVSTTIVILTLKIFDLIFVMTQGRNGTEVIADRMYKEMFTFANQPRGAALAILLVVLTVPVMYYNLKRFSEEEAF
ncbi:MAG: sugar ABC transporter permease [Candidatus Promineifilaceae bacterium]|nr:sugar ABC transporter permease [Candidatus Promineifilaceae bacterium]